MDSILVSDNSSFKTQQFEISFATSSKAYYIVNILLAFSFEINKS